MRLTDRNYKNTTLPLESCKPYLKLGMLEDLEEELGCPLEVVFKALMNGIYTKGSELDNKLELFEVRGIEKKRC